MPMNHSGNSKRLIYFGNERLVSGLAHTNAPILRGLLERGYTVVAVVSHHSESTSRNMRQLEVADIAAEYNIPVFLPHKPGEIIETLAELHADAAILAAYGRIISQQVIDLFPMGIINIHPSLLPSFRGPTPIESAIISGENTTGVSIMKLTSGMDEGPIYAKQSVELRGDEDKFELYETLSRIGSSLLFDTLPTILNGQLKPVEQEDDAATYSNLMSKSDGIIDWNKLATRIEREIRAYKNWPQSRTNIHGIDVIITKAHVIPGGTRMSGDVEITTDNLNIATRDGILSIDTLKPIGKKEMPVKAFLSGYKSKFR